MHHRTFPAVLALAALAFAGGCSGDDTGSSSAADGQQVPGASAGLGLPGSSGETADPGAPDAPNGAAGQDQEDSGDADPVDQCATALLTYTGGSLPDVCASLSPDDLDEATERAAEIMKINQRARKDTLDLIG
ncbi:hypothetical protein [Streptomyces sp. NPDC058751]|uniref:hypothetical protein n=1 Tax=Streptomyces sp. NPDC058751 TaxID=3346623 RepID=UPI00368D5559